MALRPIWRGLPDQADPRKRPRLPYNSWPDQFITVWCRDCQHIHTHSAPPGPHELPIVSQSTPPYDESEYIIEVVEIVNSLTNLSFKPVGSRKHPKPTRSQPRLITERTFCHSARASFPVCIFVAKVRLGMASTTFSDHIQRKSQGGSHGGGSVENRVLACQDCNLGKGTIDILNPET